MGKRAAAWLQELDSLREEFGPGAAAQKLDLLEKLHHVRLPHADDVYTFHELLCFLRAYPDNRAVLESVEAQLDAFDDRPDFRRWRARFENSGVKGATMSFAFYWYTALWLAGRHPAQLSIWWAGLADSMRLRAFLPLLLPYGEMHVFEDAEELDLQELVDLLRGKHETDATFLIRRFAALPTDDLGKETLYEHIDPVLRLTPGPGTPNRSDARHRRSKICYQREPLRRGRPSLPQDIQDDPLSVDDVPVREARELIDLARAAMVARERELDIFTHADPMDVRMVDWGDGLQFACFGSVPERRLLLDAVYGFLTLKNGLPMGYVMSSTLFESASVAYNVFESFRGGESGFIYGRVLAMLRYLFGARTFYIDPYQLGHDNEEGQSTGAWWFYYKCGFRPDDPKIRRLARDELARMKRSPRHRSSRRTLQALSAQNMYYDLGRRRPATLGRLSLGNAGLALSRYLAGRFGSDRERGLAICAKEVAELTGLQSLSELSPAERGAWRLWSPLVMALGDVQHWSAEERRDLKSVILAKGGRRDADYQLRFDAHRPLRRAVARLARA